MNLKKLLMMTCAGLLTSCSLVSTEAEKIITDPKVIKEVETLGEDIVEDIL